ncbi:hypothetical protein [Magnetospirillum sp. 15-1]|uniref:hypothetical protein n=1 Tax=Magnetospirillum sp. 15-1 TaxID=1979370 RepID=UPI001143AC88|nr:hypothetical protein [Magnetospirillum sp. 15-1]
MNVVSDVEADAANAVTHEQKINVLMLENVPEAAAIPVKHAHECPLAYPRGRRFAEIVQDLDGGCLERAESDFLS